MKKLLIILLVTFSLGMYAQKERNATSYAKDFTPEQQAILKTKKMALELDLNENQQNQMLELNKKWIAERDKIRASHKDLDKAEMSSTDRFNMMNSMLDKKLEQQKQIKKVLNADQYEAWKKTAKNKGKQRFQGRQGQSQGKYYKGKK